MVLLEAGKLPHRKFLSIWKLAELRGIEVTSASLTRGAYDLLRSAAERVLAREFPLLCRAAAETAGSRHRIAARWEEISRTPRPPPIHRPRCWSTMPNSNSFRGGSRWVPYHGFAGYKQMSLRRRTDSPHTNARMTTGWKHYYRKVGTRRAQAISKVCFAGAARVEAGRIADVRIALGSVAPTVLRANETEHCWRRKVLARGVARRTGNARPRNRAN